MDGCVMLKSGCVEEHVSSSRHCKLEIRLQGLGEDAATKLVGPYSVNVQ